MKNERIPCIALLVVVLAGTAARIAAYAANWSLWVDEASLALNVVGRSFAGLLLPLDSQQVAPVGVLWGMKLATIFFGPGELALRLVPLLASVAGLALFAILARRTLPPWSAVVATLFLAVNPMSVKYAAQAKQYSVDECATIVLLLVFSRVAASGWRASRGVVALLLGAGIAAILFSLPSCFALAGIGIVCCASAWRSSTRRDALAFAAVAAAWAVVFAIGYGLLYRHVSTSPYMKAFWARAFLDLAPGSVETLRWDAMVLRNLVEPFFGFGGGRKVWMATALLLAGGIGLCRHSRALFCAMAIVGGLAVAASGAHSYPLAERQAMFLSPVFALLLGAAIIPWMALRKRSFATAWSLAFGGVVAWSLVSASGATWRKKLAAPDNENIRAVFAKVSDRFEPQDAIYVYCATTDQYAYYRDYRPGVVRFASSRVLMLAEQPGLRANHACSFSFAERQQATIEELDRLCGEHTGRFWFILSHPAGVSVQRYLEPMERHGTLGDAIDEQGALARMYVLPASGS